MKNYIIALTITGVILYGIMNYTMMKFHNYNYPVNHLASPRMKLAMKFHGIRFAEGGLTFKRNGQTCKVNTVACQRYVQKMITERK